MKFNNHYKTASEPHNPTVNIAAYVTKHTDLPYSEDENSQHQTEHNRIQDIVMSEKKLAIIATKGTLDWGYPPFILASTAAALGYDVEIFFTFYGLQLLKKDINVSVSPLGNPGMPMPMAMDKWFPVIGTAIPGMQSIMTAMMKSKMKNKGVASLDELRSLCLEAEVRMVACQMTVDLFDLSTSDFINDVEYGGAATFFEFAGESDICLFV